MTRRLLSGVLVVTLAGFAVCGMDAAAVVLSAEMKTQVFRYLDSTDTDEAARSLQAMLSDPYATIDQAIRIIQTEPSLETLLRQARLRQDSRQLFPIHLAIQVRKQP